MHASDVLNIYTPVLIIREQQQGHPNYKIHFADQSIVYLPFGDGVFFDWRSYSRANLCFALVLHIDCVLHLIQSNQDSITPAFITPHARPNSNNSTNTDCVVHTTSRHGCMCHDGDKQSRQLTLQSMKEADK